MTQPIPDRPDSVWAMLDKTAPWLVSPAIAWAAWLWVADLSPWVTLP